MQDTKQRWVGIVVGCGVAAVTLLTGTQACADDPVMLFPIVKEGKWGYMDGAGAVKIEPRYDQAFDFSEGLACVTVYPYRGYIDPAGKMVIEPQFVWAGGFREGRAVAIVSKHLYGGNVNYYAKSSATYLIDRAGKYNRRARQPVGKAGFHEGKMIVTHRKGTEVYDADLKKLAHDANKVCVFSEGLAAARKGKVWGYLDHSMKWAIEPQFDGADGFSEGLAAVGKASGPPPEKKARGRKSGPDLIWGFIDKTGAIVIEQKFKDAWRFSEGLAPVRMADKWGYIDKDGNVVIEPAYDYAWPFSEGMGRVMAGKKQGFIDKQGKTVVEPQYTPAWDFSKGLARVALEDRSEGYIDKKGQCVWEPTK